VFAGSLQDLDWKWLLGACVFALATYAGRALRWAVLLRPVRPDSSLWNLLSATIIGFAAITLLGRPGEFVRPYLIAAKERVTFSSQLGAWLLERIFDLLFALLIFGFALTRVRQSEIEVGPALSWVLQAGGTFVAVASLVSLTLLLLLARYSNTMRQRLLDSLKFLPEARYRKASELVDALVRGVESTRSHHALLQLLAYTALEWGLITGCFACAVWAYGSAVPLGLLDILIFLGFVSFGTIVQLPGVGGGMQVVAVLVLTELFAVPLELATSLALTLWFITFVVVVPFGLLLAVREGLSWGWFKAIPRQEVAS